MKKFILSCILAILCIAMSAGAAWYIGNRPLQSYYSNKKVRASIPRRFFIPHGTAKIYHENGQLAYQYQIINNINNGELIFYLPGDTLTFHYVNDKILGPVISKNALKDKKNIKIVFAPNNALEITLIQDSGKINAKGRRLCKDDDFLLKLEAYSAHKSPHTLENVLSCFAIDTASYQSVGAHCQFKGEYIYPQFKTDFQTTCTLLNTRDDFKKDIKQLKVETLYTLKDDTLKIKAIDLDQTDNILILSYKGINAIIPELVDTFILSNKEISDLIPVVRKNLSISDARLIIDNKKIWELKGDINLITGFSEPYYISAYTDNKMSSQLKILHNNLSLKALYPISQTPMFALGVKFDESFKTKYQDVTKDVQETVTTHLTSQNEDSEQDSEKLADYAWKLSDLFSSLNLTVLDLQEQPVLTAQFQLKQGISAENLPSSPLAAFNIMFTTYQDGEPLHQAIGSVEEGFLIDGDASTNDEVFALLNNISLNAVLEDINNELDLKYTPLFEKARTFKDYIGMDPFFLGFYGFYKEAMPKYKLTQTISQITSLAYSIQALYEEDDDYENLSAGDLKEAEIILPEMLSSNNILLNPFGGKIRIIKSMAQENDEEIHDAFILVYEGLPADICFDLATLDWKQINSGFIGIKATSRGTADVSKAFLDKPFEQRPSQTVYKPFDAQRVCANGRASSVALKFK